MKKQELNSELDLKFLEKEKEKERIDFSTECKLKGNSYVTKEELINLLSMMNFKAVRNAHLDLITDIIGKVDSKEIEVLSKIIDIE